MLQLAVPELTIREVQLHLASLLGSWTFILHPSFQCTSRLDIHSIHYLRCIWYDYDRVA